jgi:hypothetical protein
MIYILLTSCRKNLHKLDYYRQFEIVNKHELDHYKVQFVYVIGETNESLIEDVVTLDCPDTYEDLPKKVYKGIEYVWNNKENVESIVKMDDDVKITDYSIYLIRYLSWIPYWGHKIGHLLEPETVYPQVYERFSKQGLPTIPLKRSIHAIGHTYNLNTTCIEHILKHKEDMFLGYHEDAIVGWILNQHNIYPVDFNFLLNNHFQLW